MCLEAVDQLAHVIGLCFDRAEDRPVANGAVGAEEDEIVGKVRGGKTKVRARLFGPCILEIDTGGVDDGEAGLERCVEARGADEHVNGVLVAVVTQTATFSYLVDFTVYCMHIRFAKGFEVAHAGR